VLNNTFLGDNALVSNTTGSFNTATGTDALQHNTSGGSNTATGADALVSNTTGSENTATGGNALLRNTTGGSNTANGFAALSGNTTGVDNTATGVDSLFHNTAGTNNTADGFDALFRNTGGNNIALGASAGFNLMTGSNNIYIGNQGVMAESNVIRIGTHGTQMATYVAGIDNVILPNGIPVVVDHSTGQLGVPPSSRRFKTDIKPMDRASQAILALKPVTFHYQSDAKNTPCFGLIAEDVAAVNSNLVVRDKEGKPYSVRYEAVNAMLLNEFLKEHRKVEQLEKQIETLTAGLQKVSAQTKAAPQTVLNNQ
jgi:hypothetical protein